MSREPHISASILNADFARLGEEVRRAEAGGVDSIHLDVMDGHFVDNLTFGPVVVGAVRPGTALPFHTHLMISNPLAYADRFAEAGSDLIIFHVEADDDPDAVIDAIERAGKRPGIALNPETAGDAVHPYLDRVDLLLVMTVHPGWGGQSFIADVLPKMRALRDEVDRPAAAGPDRRRRGREPRYHRRRPRVRRRGPRHGERAVRHGWRPHTHGGRAACRREPLSHPERITSCPHAATPR
jgi:ribulose-phosphate 3-epimerase